MIEKAGEFQDIWENIPEEGEIKDFWDAPVAAMVDGVMRPITGIEWDKCDTNFVYVEVS